MQYVMHYSREGYLLMLVAHGTNDAVIVEPGVGELTTPIQPDLVRHQLGELKNCHSCGATSARRAHQAIWRAPTYRVAEHTVWCDV